MRPVFSMRWGKDCGEHCAFDQCKKSLGLKFFEHAPESFEKRLLVRIV